MTGRELSLDRPDKPCLACRQKAWYWPGDYYFGIKKWLCGVCHPQAIKGEKR